MLRVGAIRAGWKIPAFSVGPTFYIKKTLAMGGYMVMRPAIVDVGVCIG